MRTTINIDDDVLAAARALADQEGRALGTVVSELIRRGLEPRTTYRVDEGAFPTFEVSDAAPPISLDTVRRALEDND
jgi:hypothetical protein